MGSQNTRGGWLARMVAWNGQLGQLGRMLSQDGGPGWAARTPVEDG